MKQLFPTYSSFTRTIVRNLLIVMYRNLCSQLLEMLFYFMLPSSSSLSSVLYMFIVI